MNHLMTKVFVEQPLAPLKIGFTLQYINMNAK